MKKGGPLTARPFAIFGKYHAVATADLAILRRFRKT